MTTDRDTAVWQHLLSAAAVMDAALESLQERLGDEAARAVGTVITSGGMMQVSCTMSLHGTKAVAVNLIGPDGALVNIATVGFEGSGADLN